MRYQPIYDIAEICFQKNIRNAVLSPGSRCAPLTLAFTRHPGITTKTFSDERSAGFIALGMAQTMESPVVVVCTSGTAAYNLAPSVAEAYFSQTPLVIITADRPAEWVAQHDGQTIYQADIFGKHVKRFFELPQDYEHAESLWAINRIVNEAVNLSAQTPPGPVHINAPFREPLYPPKEDGKIAFSPNIRIVEEHDVFFGLTEEEMQKIGTTWAGFNNVLLVVGQLFQDPAIISEASALQAKHHVPIVHDIISNLHEVEDTVQHSDLFLGQATENLKEMLRPDLLITFGQSLISKNLKIFLRRYPATRHWHVQPSGPVADTFKSLTDIFYTTPEVFLRYLSSFDAPEPFKARKQENYHKLWQVEEARILRVVDEYFKEPELNELSIVKDLIEQLPEGANLHLANSMSVRYANFIGLNKSKKAIHVFSNRGTSGIDGCTSTAVGHALLSGRPNFLITGDLAFFYDRNAFWHNYPLENLHILLLNNHGGLIFDVLEGPSSTPEASEYFITRQTLNAQKLCEEFGFQHLRPDHPKKVKDQLRDFLEFDGRTKILELETDTATNKALLQNLKLKIKTSYES